jgi:hypothetical protein
MSSALCLPSSSAVVILNEVKDPRIVFVRFTPLLVSRRCLFHAVACFYAVPCFTPLFVYAPASFMPFDY